MHAKGFTTEGTYAFDNLLAGDFPRVTAKATIASGAGELAAGTVLGKITSGGKLVAVDDSLSNGAETAYAVLAEAVDATSADAEGIIYLSGHFNSAALTFGDDDTLADHEATLRGIGIYVSTNQGA